MPFVQVFRYHILVHEVSKVAEVSWNDCFSLDIIEIPFVSSSKWLSFGTTRFLVTGFLVCRFMITWLFFLFLWCLLSRPTPKTGSNWQWILLFNFHVTSNHASRHQLTSSWERDSRSLLRRNSRHHCCSLLRYYDLRHESPSGEPECTQTPWLDRLQQRVNQTVSMAIN